MKSTIITALGLLSLALPANAEGPFVLQPAVYAREYCNLRDLGWGHKASVEHAVLQSIIPGIAIAVYQDGKKVDADVIMSFEAAKRRCPEYY